MALHRIIDEIELPISIDEAWNFFSEPENLQKLTPESMNFKHLYAPEASEVYPGMILAYRVSPILGIPITWITEITQVERHVRFVDNQIKGPFAMWHHIHEFESHGEKTICRDKLFYRMPVGFLGELAHSLFAEKQVKQIFEYRKKGLKEMFE